MAFTDWLDRRFGWDRLPLSLGIVTLMGIRNRMRQRNLADTGLEPAGPELVEAACDPAASERRSVDGTINDLERPLMGSIGTRFGRNVPIVRDVPRAGGGAARAEPANRQPRAA